MINERRKKLFVKFKLRRIGSSIGHYFPIEFLKVLGWKDGDKLNAEITTIDDKCGIFLTKE